MLTIPFVLAIATFAPTFQNRLPGSGLTGEPLKLFSSVVKTPTGANGYEEYVEAASILRNPEFGRYMAFLSWTQSPDRFEPRSPVLPTGQKGELIPVPEVPPGLTYQSTPLEARQALVNRFGGVLELVRRGNLKPVRQPRAEMDLDTLFPELANFKQLAKLAVDRAKVEFATGSTATATDTLLEGLKFSRNIADGPIIQMLVSLSSQAILLSGFEQGLGRLSLQDAKRTIQVCDQLLGKGALFQKALGQEVQFMVASSGQLVAEPQKFLFAEEGVDKNPIVVALDRLNAGQKEALVEKVRELLKARYEQAIARFSRPEKEWHRATELAPAVNPDLGSIEGLAAALASETTPLFGQAAQAEARSRAQLRILRLTAKIVAFRWTQDRLPHKLEEVVPSADIEDPASGEKFAYEVTGPYQFKVYSKGFGSFGPIGLVYRRPPANENTAGEPGPRPPQ